MRHQRLLRTSALIWLLLGSAFTVMAAEVAAPPAPQPEPLNKPPPVVKEPDGFWTGDINSPVPDTIEGGKVIHTQDLDALLKGKKGVGAVIVDVSMSPHRPDNLPASSTWIPVPHPALPKAIWIPDAGLGAPPPAVEKLFSEKLAANTANDKARPVVLYCHEKCWLSWNGAKRAIQLGYTKVYWYPDGIEGWRKAKLPTDEVKPLTP